MFEMSILDTVTHLFTRENKMDLRTRMKIITKKNDCFKKFIQPYLFTADGRKRGKKKPNQNSTQTPPCCIRADFHFSAPLQTKKEDALT